MLIKSVKNVAQKRKYCCYGYEFHTDMSSIIIVLILSLQTVVSITIIVLKSAVNNISYIAYRISRVNTQA